MIRSPGLRGSTCIECTVTSVVACTQSLLRSASTRASSPSAVGEVTPHICNAATLLAAPGRVERRCVCSSRRVPVPSKRPQHRHRTEEKPRPWSVVCPCHDYALPWISHIRRLHWRLDPT